MLIAHIHKGRLESILDVLVLSIYGSIGGCVVSRSEFNLNAKLLLDVLPKICYE